MTTLLTRADEMKALVELRRQVRQEGLERQSPALALAIFALHLVIMLGGIAVFVAADSLWIAILALLISTYSSLGIGMTGHNASHIGVTGDRRYDRALMYLTMSFLHGTSATYWRHKHVQLHHSGPNNIGIDSDIELLPLFALSEDEMAQARGWRRKMYEKQHWIFPVAIAFIVLNLQWAGVRYLAGELRGPRRRSAAIWFDIAGLSLHLVVFVLLPMLVWPVWQVIAFTLLREALNGYAVFVGAAPAHFPAEAKFVRAEDDDGPGLLACQIYTTVNFRTGFWGRLACLGAEYQIEHHLLPNANPLKMGRVSEIVQAFCRRHGYPYRTLGWWEGIWKSLTSLKTPKRIHTVDELVGA